MSNNRNGKLFTAKDIAVLALIVAILEVSKLALSFLPNVELVSFFIIVFTYFYGWKILPAVIGFVGIEIIIYGFGVWTISYLYLWPLLVAMTMLVRRFDSAIVFSLISAVFGMFFGTLYSITVLIIEGPAAAFGSWVSGIPFDMIHCVANFVICILLYKPITAAIRKITENS